MKQDQSKLNLYFDALRELYRRDFLTFAREQLMIKGAAPGQILRMQLSPSQMILHKRFQQQKAQFGYIRQLIVKPRQIGSSTLTEGYMFHGAALNQNFNTLLVALNDDTTSKIFDMCRMYYDNLHQSLKPMIRYDNKQHLVFENPDAKTRGRFPGLRSSMDFSSAKNMQAGTGSTRQGLHISERAKFHPNQTTFLKASLYPIVHLVPGTIIIDESTAFVEGDDFRNACDDARVGASPYWMNFIPWYIPHVEKYEIPLLPGEHLQLTAEERFMQKLAEKGQEEWGIPPMTIRPEQFKWYRFKIAEAGDEGDKIVAQEYPTTYESAWVTFDRFVFSRKALHELERGVKNPELKILLPGPKVLPGPEAYGSEENYLAIWKEPEKGHSYDIGVDCAAGIEGGDWSVAEVFDRDTHEQVAEFHVQKEVFALADDIYWLGMYYNKGQVIIETNGIGYAVNQAVMHKGYPWVYIWRHRDKVGQTLSSYTGWKTQHDSKMMIVALLRLRFNELQATIHSRMLLNELRDFISIPGYTDEYRAARGHDDCVMAAGIAFVGGYDEKYGVLDGKPLIISDKESVIEAVLRTSGPAFVDIRGTEYNVKEPLTEMRWLEGW